MEPASPLVRVCVELIALRERCDRQHQQFEQQLAELRERWSRFVADSQEAYQQLRDELTGRERLETALLNELIERTLDLERLAAAGLDVGVALRASLASLARFGVERIAPAAGDRYDATRHERLGGDSDTVERVDEPGFTAGGRLLRRARVWLG